MAATESRSQEPDDLKLRQIEKLELEIEDLRKPLYRQPTVLFGVVGSVVAIGSLVISTVDARRDANEAQAKVESLSKDVQTAEGRLAEVGKAEADARAAAQEAGERRAAAEKEIAAMGDLRTRLEAEILAKHGKIGELTDELNRNKSQLDDSRQVLVKLQQGDVSHETKATIRAALEATPRPDLLACAVAPGPLFVGVGQAGTIVVSTDQGATWRRQRMGDSLLTAVDASPNGSTVCVGTWDGRILVSNDRASTFVQSFRLEGTIEGVATSPDGRTMAAWSTKQLARSVAGGGSWQATPVPFRALPSGGLRALDNGAIIAIGRLESPPAGGARQSEGIVELTYRGPTLEDPETLAVRDSGDVTALCGAPAETLVLAAWNPREQPEFRGSLLRRSAREPRWSKIPASRVPQIRAFWCSPDQTRFVVVSHEGRLIEAQTNLTGGWQEYSGKLPQLVDIAGTPDGSVLWGVGKDGTVVRKVAGAHEWQVLTAVFQDAP